MASSKLPKGPSKVQVMLPNGKRIMISHEEAKAKGYAQ